MLMTLLSEPVALESHGRFVLKLSAELPVKGSVAYDLFVTCGLTILRMTMHINSRLWQDLRTFTLSLPKSDREIFKILFCVKPYSYEFSDSIRHIRLGQPLSEVGIGCQGHFRSVDDSRQFRLGPYFRSVWFHGL